MTKTPTVFLPPDSIDRNRHHTEERDDNLHTLEMDNVDKQGNRHPDYAAYEAEMERQYMSSKKDWGEVVF